MSVIICAGPFMETQVTNERPGNIYTRRRDILPRRQELKSDGLILDCGTTSHMFSDKKKYFTPLAIFPRMTFISLEHKRNS